MNRGYGSPKVDMALDKLSGMPLSIRDWFLLARACCDQAGMPIYVQTRVRKAIEGWWGTL